MSTTSKTLRICKNGHRYYKSSDCPVCPMCEEEKKPQEGFLSLLGAPARRALERAGIHTEKDLSSWTEKELLLLHGLGPASLPKLRNALKLKDLSFKKA